MKASYMYEIRSSVFSVTMLARTEEPVAVLRHSAIFRGELTVRPRGVVQIKCPIRGDSPMTGPISSKLEMRLTVCL